MTNTPSPRCAHPSARNIDLDGKKMTCHTCEADVPPNEYCGVCGIKIEKGKSICDNCRKGFR